jgi:hypothetical protein
MADIGEEEYNPNAGEGVDISSSDILDSPSPTILNSSFSGLPIGGSAEAVDNPYDDDKTFLTQPSQSQPPAAETKDHILTMSDAELLEHIEAQMLEYERNAQYIEAERARQHLESIKKRNKANEKADLSLIQREDIRLFFSMVQSHQEGFDSIWTEKTAQHKARADELINTLKYRHDEQQRELYEILRKKRMPKFSVELLNMRKKQVLLAKARNYIPAEKIKRKADMLEAIEIEKIRTAAKAENQLRFQTLLKKQEFERNSLAQKLKIEKKALLEAKQQDFIRLKKRLKNAEAELKKTHIRQQLLADKKLLPNYAIINNNNNNNNNNSNNNNQSLTARSNGSSSSRLHQTSTLRNSGQRIVQSSDSHASSNLSNKSLARNAS